MCQPCSERAYRHELPIAWLAYLWLNMNLGTARFCKGLLPMEVTNETLIENIDTNSRHRF